jgi:polysaccharide export outer membrane protein
MVIRSRGRVRVAGVLLGLLTLSSVAAAQQQSQDAKPKRPPLRARVVTGEKGGVPVVVNGGAAEVAGSANTAGVPAAPEVENWLTGAPVQPESWLTSPAATGRAPSGDVAATRLTVSTLPATAGAPPAALAQPGVTTGWTDLEPQDTAQESSPTQLVGVQHYMESTQAEGTWTPPPTRAEPSATDEPARADTTPSRGTAREAISVPVPRPVGAAQPLSSAPTSAPAPVYTPTSVGPATTSSASAGAPTSARYQLGPGDQIDVHVWRNEELSRSVPVRPDGLISLPLAGELIAAGKTVAELEAEITATLADFVQNPTVTVTVTQVRGMVVYVLGRVGRAGTLVLDRPVNVVQAIAMAGGLQEFADRNGVVVIRTVNGREVRMPFRYGDALKGKGDVASIVLQSGDVIYVP